MAPSDPRQFSTLVLTSAVSTVLIFHSACWDGLKEQYLTNPRRAPCNYTSVRIPGARVGGAGTHLHIRLCISSYGFAGTATAVLSSETKS